MVRRRETDDDAEQGHGLLSGSRAWRLPLAASAGLLPLAGFAGRGSRMDPDSVRRYADARALLAQAKPGDVILNGYMRSGGLLRDLVRTKGLASMAMGAPNAYHAALVLGDGQHGFPLIGELNTEGLGRITPKSLRSDNFMLLRSKLKPDEIEGVLQRARAYHDYSEALKSEARRVGGEEFAQHVGNSLYSKRQGLSAGLRELFLPKVRSQAAYTKEWDAAQKVIDARDTSPVRAMWRMYQRDPRSTSKFISQLPPAVQAMCSSAVARMLPRDRRVIPGKTTSEVLPTDFLNSAHYTPVGRVQRVRPPAADSVLRRLPIAARSLAGLGLAGATYGLSGLASSVFSS